MGRHISKVKNAINVCTMKTIRNEKAQESMAFCCVSGSSVFMIDVEWRIFRMIYESMLKEPIKIAHYSGIAYDFGIGSFDTIPECSNQQTLNERAAEAHAQYLTSGPEQIRDCKEDIY